MIMTKKRLIKRTRSGNKLYCAVLHELSILYYTVLCYPILAILYYMSCFLKSVVLNFCACLSNPVFHYRTKHISIKFQCIDENVENVHIVLQYLKSKGNLAHMFTKSTRLNTYLTYYVSLMGTWSLLKVLKAVKITVKGKNPVSLDTLSIRGMHSTARAACFFVLLARIVLAFTRVILILSFEDKQFQYIKSRSS
jgi:hypothetical protein